MFAVFKRNPLALVLAILLHIGLAIFLVLEVDWRSEVTPIGGDVKVVQAELVAKDPYEVEKKNKEAERKALEKRRAEEKRKLAEIEAARKQREQEDARKAAEKQRKAEAEKARQAEIERKQVALQKKQEAEKKRKEEEKRKAEEKRVAEEQRKAEEKRKAEAKAKAEKERKARLAREKAEKARKAREAAEARARAEREAELAAQFAAEQDASELARVSGLIKEKVERNWRRPPGTEGLKCTVSVRLGLSGSVLLVNVVKSSGSIAFDRSVEAAVRKADPLPMPTSERLLAQFRSGLTFIFDPSS